MRGNPRRRRGRRLPDKWPTSSWPLSLRASSLLSSSPLELHPLSIYKISSIVIFDIAEIERLVKSFFSFFPFGLDRPDRFIRLRFTHRMPYEQLNECEKADR